MSSGQLSHLVPERQGHPNCPGGGQSDRGGAGLIFGHTKPLFSPQRRKERKEKMQILYNSKTDLLYLRLDELKQKVMNKRLSEDVVLDMVEEDRIVGIEILDASRHLNLERLLPVKYEVSGEAT